MRKPISQRTLRRGYLELLGGAVCCAAVACQSAPPSETREPVREPPSPSAGAAPAPQAQTTQPLQGPAPSPPEAAAATAVKLTTARAVAAAPNTVRAADAPSGKPAEPKATAAKATQGAVVSEEAFSTWLQAESPAKAGGPVQLQAVLVAKAPYHCNAEYPHKFKLNAAPAGLAYPAEVVRGMQVTPERSVLAIPVNAQSAGKPTVSGTLSFSVCTEERCMVEKRDLSLALEVSL